MFAKDELDIDDKNVSQNQSSMELIEKCAENGTWVLISTLKFPSFWFKISRRLEKMQKKGKVLNTFRLFFDLQGYSLQEIPESFLFDHCVKFFLTERNNEDMEGFNDIWANILNDDILNARDLTNVPVLEQPSELHRLNLNLDSRLPDSSMESLVPYPHKAHRQSDERSELRGDTFTLPSVDVLREELKDREFNLFSYESGNVQLKQGIDRMPNLSMKESAIMSLTEDGVQASRGETTLLKGKRWCVCRSLERVALCAFRSAQSATPGEAELRATIRNGEGQSETTQGQMKITLLLTSRGTC